MTSVVCTLFEGAYHYGLGVLINSLVRNGFRGQIIAGHRGPLPPWCSQLRQVGDASDPSFLVDDGCQLAFMPIQTDVHFTNYKPRFVLDMLESRARDADSVFYFDPDIVVCCRWSFFEAWVQDGVALCEDVNWRMSNDHPMRNAWRRYFCERGVKLPIARDAYYNAGFVGVSRDRSSFFCEWDQILSMCDFDRQMLAGKDPTYLFKGVDQDALNITTMKTQLPLSTVGPGNMGFRTAGGGFAMCHSVGRHKPWNHSLSWDLITKGRPVKLVDRLFFDYTSNPIRVFSSWQSFLRKLDRWLAGGLSRFLK